MPAHTDEATAGPVWARAETSFAPKVLLVEDDDAISTALALLLESEGYVVRTASTGRDGLALLVAEEFDLIVTDYDMPLGTGSWMLEKARGEGRGALTPALMITAQRGYEPVDGVEVYRKPLGIEDFLRRVHEKLAPARARELERRKLEARRREQAHARGRTPDIELVLYVCAASPASLRALEGVERCLEGVDRSRVRLTVRDLAEEPFQALDGRHPTFLPALVQHRPHSRVWIGKHLDDTRALEESIGRALLAAPALA